MYELRPLDAAQVEALLRRALADPERGIAEPPPVEDAALAMLAERSGGDARVALSGLERAVERAQGKPIDVAAIEDALQRKAIDYDRQGDRHYDFVSAWIKATRGSDVDASLYYLAVMLEGGEDPRFIARRMVILASEDIGNADPRALLVADAAARAVDRVGLPECALNLAQACVYLALAPKSNASYKALEAARAEVREHGAQTPPDYLRDVALPRRQASSAAATATATPTTSRAGSATSSCCPTASRAAASTPRPTAASRPSWASASPSCVRDSDSPSDGRNFLKRTGFQWAAFQARARESRHTHRRPGLGASGGDLTQGGEGAEWDWTRRPLYVRGSPSRPAAICDRLR